MACYTDHPIDEVRHTTNTSFNIKFSLVREALFGQIRSGVCTATCCWAHRGYLVIITTPMAERFELTGIDNHHDEW